MLDNIHDRQVRLVILGQRNSALHDMLAGLQVIHHTKYVFKALHFIHLIRYSSGRSDYPGHALPRAIGAAG